MRTRAERRHYTERVKAKARYLGAVIWGHGEEFGEVLARFADSIPTCSCYMCGNPRRHFKRRTRKERVDTLLDEW